MDVHVGLDGQLARGTHNRESCCHRACTACSNEPACVKHENTTPRCVKGQLDCGEAAGSEVCVTAARSDGVQVERQLESRSRDGDGLCQCDHIHEPRHQVEHAVIVAERQAIRPLGGLAHGLVAQVLGRLERTRAFALHPASADRLLNGTF